MKVNLKDAKKIDGHLRKTNGRATPFVIGGAVMLWPYVRDAERQLAEILPIAAWEGASLICRPAGPPADGIKSRAKSTICMLERGENDWFLVLCAQQWIYPDSPRCCDLELTPLQGRVAMICADKRLQSEFGVSGLRLDFSTPEDRELERAACQLVCDPAPIFPTDVLPAANGNRTIVGTRDAKPASM